MVTAAMYKLIGSAPDDGVTRALSGWSDERLQALLAARPDLADPPPPDFEALGFRAALAQSVAACRRHLDQWCLQVLDSLCLLSSPATVGALRRLLGHPVDEGDLDRALGRLEDLALVFRSGDELRPVHGAQELPYPAGLGPPADEVLGRRSAAELAAMARRLGATAGRTKTATLAALAGALADPTVVRAAVEGGPEGTDELVDELAWRYPAVSVPGGTAYLYDRTPVGWLANRGLVVPVSWNSVVMPREAGVGLRGGRPFPVLANRPPALDPVAVDAGAVDTAGAEHALRLVGDVATVLDAFGEAPPRMLKTGGVGIRDVRRMAKATGRTESGAAWLVELAGAAGLVAADEATGGALPTAAYDEWLGLEAPRRWSWLVAAWLGAELHLSVAGAIDAKDKPVPPLAPWCPEPHAVPQRRLVLEALAEAGTGGAVDTATLRQRIAWAGPAVWSAGPVPPRMLMDWAVAETAQLGLAALGSLTGAGHRVVAGDLEGAARALAALAPPVVDRFVLQADLSAMAPGELAPPVRAELELLADVESTGAATVYRFSESSLRRGLAAGRAAADILAFLESHASKGVPQPLAYLVADLGRRHGQVRVGQAQCYVRSDDPSLLAEVRRSRRTASLGLRELAPTVLVTQAPPATVLAALHGAGYLAAEEGADGGLVLAAHRPRRATVAPTARRAPVVPADGAAIVAALRRAGASPPAGRHVPPMRPVTALELAIFGPDDDLERPTEIMRQPAAVRALVEAACEEGWLLRLAYADGGREAQVTAGVVDVAGGAAVLECAPGWDTRSLPLARVRWARALTEAEEEHVL